MFRTGDLVDIDEEGYVPIKGRIKEIIINTSGKNMNPGAIEHAGSGAQHNPHELAEHPAVIENVAAAVQRGNAKLSRIESVRKFVIVGDIWMPDGTLLTQNMKIRRAAVLERYADQIDILYAGADHAVVPR